MSDRLKFPYQVFILGAADKLGSDISKLIVEELKKLGLAIDAIRLLTEADASGRDPRVPTIAIFFGSPGADIDASLLAELTADSISIIPVVTSVSQVYVEIPSSLAHINVVELGPRNEGLIRLATLIMENFRLLRRERRIFISYRRKGSQPLANRLYDALDARGFDVFIDVRSVPPGVDFQSQLWHRMSDSDVIVLIDTPGFREGRWTAAELARANATNIQILHLLWPGMQEDASSSFSHFYKLRRLDFFGLTALRGRYVRDVTVRGICNEVELLRARAIAARYRYLVDNFCDAARDFGLVPLVQAEGWISIDVNLNRTLAVVPAVGIPTSDRVHEVFDAVTDPRFDTRAIWLIFDNRGVLDRWLNHLGWLDSHLPVRTVQMAKVTSYLADLVS